MKVLLMLGLLVSCSTYKKKHITQKKVICLKELHDNGIEQRELVNMCKFVFKREVK